MEQKFPLGVTPWIDDETKLAVEGLRYLRPFGRRLEQSGKKPFLKMTKDKPTATGPMTMQPSQHGEILPTLLLMPSVACGPKTSPSPMDAVDKAMATSMRRKSLQKQRVTLKANSR